jgi:hypothetical protein
MILANWLGGGKVSDVGWGEADIANQPRIVRPREGQSLHGVAESKRARSVECAGGFAVVSGGVRRVQGYDRWVETRVWDEVAGGQGPPGGTGDQTDTARFSWGVPNG